MKVALVHYWLVNWRGGEKVLATIADMFPDADIFTHVADRELCAKHLPARHILETFIAKLPLAKRWYQRYLPLMPLALEELDLREYDLVISFESGPAKGVIVAPHAIHVCYCHSPMRYVWDMYHDYRSGAGLFTRLLMGPLLHYIRLWDQLSAQRVDHFIANSAFVAARIAKYYRREAEVIYPCVDIDEFQTSTTAGDFYLMVGQLVPYKRADLAVEAFNRLGLPLVVIGEGEMLDSLREMASSNVKIIGRQSWQTILQHYRECRAVVFPGIEDFGLVPVEAMASGKPVLAYRGGGALETVAERVSGLFFDEQSADSLMDGVRRMEEALPTFDASAIQRHAAGFGRQRFVAEIRRFIERCIEEHRIPAEGGPRSQ